MWNPHIMKYSAPFLSNSKNLQLWKFKVILQKYICISLNTSQKSYTTFSFLITLKSPFIIYSFWKESNYVKRNSNFNFFLYFWIITLFFSYRRVASISHQLFF